MRTLSVIIPTRNERENVPRLLGALRTALAGVDYELLFVDDSTDGTDQLLAEVAREDPRIAVHHRERGRGLASAVVEGFHLSRSEAVAVIDADLQHPPSLLPALLDRLLNAPADIVVASRYLPDAGRPGLSARRLLISQITRRLAQAMLRGARRSTDPLSGFFVLRRAVVEGVTLQPVGFKILLEILVRGRYQGVAEVPYVFTDRAGGQTKATVGAGAEFLRHVAALAASNPSDARLLKFLMVGTSGVLVNVAVFWGLTQPLSVHYLAAGVAAGLLATGSNYLLNSAFTWADRPSRTVSTFLSRMGRYYVATWVGFLLYLALLWGFTHLGVVPMLSNLIAVGISGLVNYLMHNVWTWRHLDARS
jgi:dolichol-phosphate mannosyltransferase